MTLFVCDDETVLFSLMLFIYSKINQCGLQKERPLKLKGNQLSTQRLQRSKRQRGRRQCRASTVFIRRLKWSRVQTEMSEHVR